MRPAHFETSALRIDKYDVGPYENNAYVIRCKNTGDAVLVDAANEHDFLIPICRAANVRTVLTTHGHSDHIQAVTAARDAGIDVGVAELDAYLLPGYDFVLHDEQHINVGSLRIEVIHTPGHTPGSLCFRLLDAPIICTGDTLFPGGPGTTQLPGGDFDAIINAIDARLFSLSGDAMIYPGHGLDTTLDTERPALSSWIDRGW
jgi:glyoxylase-like metal-dependent hydrolase (beta-lactamase superfamily II)